MGAISSKGCRIENPSPVGRCGRSCPSEVADWRGGEWNAFVRSDGAVHIRYRPLDRPIVGLHLLGCPSDWAGPKADQQRAIKHFGLHARKQSDRRINGQRLRTLEANENELLDEIHPLAILIVHILAGDDDEILNSPKKMAISAFVSLWGSSITW